MSIATRIESIEEHIEQAYDELQGLGADLTNVNKNIENISMVLDDIYDSMPQVSGEGTSLILDDTRVGKIKSTLKGNTSQTGTPTPTTPIPVNVVSGDNKLNIENKNLLDENNLSNTWVAYPSGEIQSAPGANIVKIKCKEGDKISVSAKYTNPSSSSVIVIAFYDKENNNLLRNAISNQTNPTLTRTAPATTSYAYAGRYLDTPTEVQVEHGEVTEYQPRLNDTYPINLGVENLLQNNLTSGTINGITYVVNEDKSVTLSGTATSITWLILNNNLPLEAGTYTMSQGYTGNDVRMYSTGLGTYTVDGVKTITKTTSISGDVSINIPNGTAITTPITIKPMIEKSSKAHSYTPYGTTPIELCKIGNYQDYFGKSTGKNLWHFTSEALYSVNSVSPTIINENTLKLVSTSNTYANVLYLLDLPNDSYTFSLGRVNNSNSSMTTKRMSLVEIVNGTITVIQHIDEGTSYTATIANESGKKYGLRFWATWNTALVNTATFNEIQIEKGTQATTYEPYGKVWYLTKQTSKITFNGSENWGRSGNTSESFFCGVLAGTGIPFKAKMETAIDSKCDYFTKGNSRSNAEVFDMYNGTDYYTAFALYLSTNKVTDITAFKSWLASNNITLYYVLYQPTTEVVEYQPLIDQLNELEKAMSKDGQTNISQVNNDLPFIISASALKKG